MNLVKYIKENGMRHTLKIFYQYKIDLILQQVLKPFLIDKPLRNIIMIESHDDFDSNGGAFYNYLIQKGYNKKYKIVWLIKHPELVPEKLPNNVEYVIENRPGIKKNYYKWVAKWFSADQNCSVKLRNDQISIYLTHGSIGLKDCTGLIALPENLDYCLTASEFSAQIDARQYQWNYPNSKLKVCGFPVHDAFYTSEQGDLQKVTNKRFKRVILWMPTFRKSINGRCDCVSEEKMGIPLINSEDEYRQLNEFLRKNDILLIIKLHPKQDISELKINNESNIKVLTGRDVKKWNIDNIRLMKDVDAMISDYSAAAYDFLHVDRPIAYDFSDLDKYVIGIIVEDVREMIAGHEIKNIADMFSFIEDVSNGIDPFREKRKLLFNKVFKYHDGNSSKRVADLLGL